MEIGKKSMHLAMATEPGKLIATVLMLVHFVLSWYVMSIVVLLRRNFGERYLSWVNIGFGLLAISLMSGFGNIVLSPANVHISHTIGIAYNIVVLASLYHRWVIWRRNKSGLMWHSYFSGYSWIQIPGISAETVQKWIEPILLLVLGSIAGHLHEPTLRLWLMVSGVAMLAHEQVAYFLQRQMILDMQDGIIEQRNWAQVMAGKDVRQTQGYTIAKSNLDVIAHNSDLRSAFETLPDDMKAILDKKEAA